jgi:hypothetical protein
MSRLWAHLARARRKGWGLVVLLILLCIPAAPAGAAIISGAGTGDITFHSSLFADALIFPSNTTGPAVMPELPGPLLSLECFAPGGAEHAYMEMGWDFSASEPRVIIPTPGVPATTTRLELVPSPPASAHHSATMTGTFEIIYTLDAAGLPATVVPGQTYQVHSYVSPIPGSPAAASFVAHWEYEDVGVGPGFGVLGTQDIAFAAPVGLGVVTPVSSLPLAIAVPAGHTTLKVSGFFMLSAESDDFLGELPPFDTLIAIVPEPATFALATCGGLALVAAALYRRRRRR